MIKPNVRYGNLPSMVANNHKTFYDFFNNDNVRIKSAYQIKLIFLRSAKSHVLSYISMDHKDETVRIQEVIIWTNCSLKQYTIILDALYQYFQD